MYSRIVQDTPAELNYPRFDDQIEDLAIIDHMAVRKVDLFHNIAITRINPGQHHHEYACRV
jgi:hypothetical protein